MDGSGSQTIKRIIFRLADNELLSGKLYIAGGIVPYLYSGRESARKHADIDVVVQIHNMMAVRQYLANEGLYRADWDSTTFPFNRWHTDHGVEALIDNVPVNFAPFEVVTRGIVQKNFAMQELSGYDALLTATMDGISPEDYITSVELGDGKKIGTYTLEMVKCAKENSGRGKDAQDIREIERVGIDNARYARIKPAVQGMRITAVSPEG